jgi:hypothetical protein
MSLRVQFFAWLLIHGKKIKAKRNMICVIRFYWKMIFARSVVNKEKQQACIFF